jgi:hypothetical protein
MEQVAGDIEACRLDIGDLRARLLGSLVEGACDLEPGLGGGRADQLDHGQAVGQRTAAPVLDDAAEQPVLDPVPLRHAGRIVMDVQGEPCRIGERLQFRLPQPHTRPV